MPCSIDGTVESLFPNVGDLEHSELKSNGVFYPMFFGFNGFYVIVFSLLFAFGFQQQKSEKFLAPYKPNHDPNYCTSSPLSISRDFWVDSNGNWEGSANYDSSNPIYMLKMDNARMELSEYSSMIKYFDSEMERISLKAATRDSVWNYVAYSSYSIRYECSKGGSVSMYLAGDASVVFGKSIKYDATLLNGKDIYPPYEGTTAFDIGSSKLNINFWVDYTGGSIGEPIVIVEPIPTILKIADNDCGFEFNLGIAKASIDVRSLSTVLAINYGLADYENLINMGDLGSLKSIWEKEYSSDYAAYSQLRQNLDILEHRKMGYYTDPFYPGMDPILCGNYDGKKSCALMINGKVVLPVTSSMGPVNLTQSAGCIYRYGQTRCSSITDTPDNCELNGQNGQFYVGFIFIPKFKSTNTATFGNLIEWQDVIHKFQVQSDDNYDEQFQDAAYSSMSITPLIQMFLKDLGISVSNYTSDVANLHDTLLKLNLTTTTGIGKSSTATCPDSLTENLRKSFKENLLCETCSMMTVGFSNNFNDAYGNFFGYPIGSGSTRFLEGDKSKYSSQIYKPSIFASIIQQPPTTLVDTVMICTSPESQVAMNNFGVTISNAQVIFSIFCTVVTGILVFVWNRMAEKHPKMKRMLTAKEKQKLLKQAHFALLRLIGNSVNRKERKMYYDVLHAIDLLDETENIPAIELIEIIKKLRVYQKDTQVVPANDDDMNDDDEENLTKNSEIRKARQLSFLPQSIQDQESMKFRLPPSGQPPNDDDSKNDKGES